MSHGQRFFSRASPHITPDLGLVPAIDYQHVQQSIAVQIGQHATATAPEAGYARLLARFHEATISLLEQQIVRIQRREIGHGRYVSFHDEQVCKAIVIHVSKLRMPCR